MTNFQRARQAWRNNRARIDWRNNQARINWYTEGIVWVIGRCLHRLMWFTPTQLASIVLPKDRIDCFTEWYVFVALIASVLIYYLIHYLAPDLLWLTYFLAWLSTYFSASSLIVWLHIVLLQRAFAPIKSPQRSLVLFTCNVVQIVVMFATWYRLCGEPDPLLKSVLTFATIGYAKTMPGVAIAQIATDFLLLAIFLGFVIGQFGAKDGGK